uniref:Reverse transcriptase domain-containing protein n=1 Tax=Amphimedon queenslandica TaxID=400682 RepID=A0A1X7U3J0_AMPQE
MKVDLKAAYLTIPIHQSDRQFLRFSTESQDFQVNYLPFGLSRAHWVITKTLANPAQRTRCQACGIHRRHSSPGKESGKNATPHRGFDIPPGETELCSTSRQICQTTNPKNRSPRNDGQLGNERDTPPRPGNKETEKRGSHDDQRQASSSYCSRSVTLTGEIQISFQSKSSSPTILQGITERFV